jgi:hypothetical protein
MFARFAQMSDVPVLNFEQDLGIPALARAKQALSPITRLQKFRLSKEPS